MLRLLIKRAQRTHDEVLGPIDEWQQQQHGYNARDYLRPPPIETEAEVAEPSARGSSHDQRQEDDEKGVDRRLYGHHFDQREFSSLRLGRRRLGRGVALPGAI